MQIHHFCELLQCVVHFHLKCMSTPQNVFNGAPHQATHTRCPLVRQPHTMKMIIRCTYIPRAPQYNAQGLCQCLRVRHPAARLHSQRDQSVSCLQTLPMDANMERLFRDLLMHPVVRALTLTMSTHTVGLHTRVIDAFSVVHIATGNVHANRKFVLRAHSHTDQACFSIVTTQRVR